LAALYNKILAFHLSRTENRNDPSNANQDILNNTAAGPSNVRREILQKIDNDYDSSSDDENPNYEVPPSEDVTLQCDANEPAEFDTHSVETLRKSLQSDLKRNVKKEVRALKNELNSNIKSTIREDLKLLKDEMIQDLKRTNIDLLKSFVSDLKVANEALMNKSTMELKECNQVAMQSFKEEFSSLREMFLNETKRGINVDASANLTSTVIQEKDMDENSDDKTGDDDAERCDEEGNFKTTLVQTIEESRSPVGLQRFQRTSNLVVLGLKSFEIFEVQLVSVILRLFEQE